MLGAVGMALIQFGAQLGNADLATRMYGFALPLGVFLLLRGVAGALRGDRIRAQPVTT